MTARGWIAGFRRDAAAARAWLSKRWTELNLAAIAPGTEEAEKVVAVTTLGNYSHLTATLCRSSDLLGAPESGVTPELDVFRTNLQNPIRNCTFDFSPRPGVIGRAYAGGVPRQHAI